MESRHSSFVWLFAPKNIEGGRDLHICQSVSEVSVVGTLIGGGDIRTLTALIKFIWTFYTRSWSGH